MGFLLSFIFVIGLGSIQFGYSISVFNPLQQAFNVFLEWPDDKKDLYQSLITAMCSTGAAIGAFGSGYFSKYGKKRVIIAANLFVVVGLSITMIEDTIVIIIGRFIYGISAGIFSVYVPGFINEICPNELKGPIGALTNGLICIGCLIASLLGLAVPDITKQEDKDKY